MLEILFFFIVARIAPRLWVRQAFIFRRTLRSELFRFYFSERSSSVRNSFVISSSSQVIVGALRKRGNRYQTLPSSRKSPTAEVIWVSRVSRVTTVKGNKGNIDD